jgi:hypothetical protein
MVIGVIALVMGIAALTGWWPASWGSVIEPTWHMWLKVVIGVIAVWVAYADQKPTVQ